MRSKFTFALFAAGLSILLLIAGADFSSAAPLPVPHVAYTPESYVVMEMHSLTDVGGDRGIPCSPDNNKDWGCTAFCDNRLQNGEIDHSYDGVCGRVRDPVHEYPYASSSLTVPVESWYLLNVVSQEMNPAIYSRPGALQAQAIAARSYLGWQMNNSTGTFTNANAFQVFIPYRFDRLNPSAAPLEPGQTSPCGQSGLNNAQRAACQAVAPRYYLARSDVDLPAFAEFSSDVMAQTVSYVTPTPSGLDFPYLRSVPEPISNACDADNGGHGRGMSQEGAVRWAAGNQCALPVYGYQPWSVIWTRPEQILFHYYTGVHLRDANDNNNVLSPDYRWNPLQIQWNTPGNRPPFIVSSGEPHWVEVTAQNSGVTDWTCDSYYSYILTATWRRSWGVPGVGGAQPEAVTGECNLCPTVAKGQTSSCSLNIQPPDWVSTGGYMLGFDILQRSAPLSRSFREMGWPAYEISVCVDSCATYAPLISMHLAPPPTETATPSPTPTITRTPTVTRTLARTKTRTPTPTVSPTGHSHQTPFLQSTIQP